MHLHSCVAECFAEKSSGCRNEQVCQRCSVKCFERSNQLDTVLYKIIPLRFIVLLYCIIILLYCIVVLYYYIVLLFWIIVLYAGPVHRPSVSVPGSTHRSDQPDGRKGTATANAAGGS